MTCVIAIIDEKNNCVWAGGDTQVSSRTHKGNIRDRKVYKLVDNAETTVTTCGSVLLRNIMSTETGIIDELDYLKGLVDKTSIIKKTARTIFKLCVAYNATHCIHGKHEMDGAMILSHKNRIYLIQSDFSVYEPLEKYAAYGSGSEYALGELAATDGTDMSPKDRITYALMAASKDGIGIGAPFHIMNTMNDELITITEEDIKKMRK